MNTHISNTNKKIVILTCLNANKVCTGASCIDAFNKRVQNFATLLENIKLGAFMRCNGCGIYPGQDAGLDEKIDCILKIKPEAVYLGVCTRLPDKSLCPVIQAICVKLEQAGIVIRRGTHSRF